MTAKEYYELAKSKIDDLTKIVDDVVKAIFGTPGSKGVLVRLARIEIQIYGIYAMLTGVIGMLIKLIWFNEA